MCGATLWCCVFWHNAQANLELNQLAINNAPKWMKHSQVEKVVKHVERFLEWDIRRVQVKWYTDAAAFQSVHKLDGSVLAYTKRADGSIHLGPRVTVENFEGILGHELTHVVLFQKYKDAVPPWLEEGLANFVGKRGTIDYKELAEAKSFDVYALGHAFNPSSGVSARVHYMASSAVMQMIASKCNIHELLQLSIGQDLKSYLATYCEIADLNAAYKAWIKRKNK